MRIEISLFSAMAKETKYSSTHLLRIFRASTGLTPHQYLIDLRIERAQRLLRNRDARLIHVAIECGFSSQAHLTRVFKARRGMTPEQYQRQCSFWPCLAFVYRPVPSPILAHLCNSVLHPAVHSCFEAAAVEPGQTAHHLVGKERVMPRRDEGLGDAPDVFLGGHPVLVV